MPNLSQEKRQYMLEFLNTLREKNSEDDDALKAISEIENELKSKKYGLVWEQHEENVDVQMRENIPVFTECKDKEITVDSNEGYNFILEGDNLHSLKLLEKTHKGNIDVIYIDPPYNTGNSFMYNDKIVDDADTYKHSKWASFMSERLACAKILLADDGVIFISINDFEGAHLKLICDDIFGEKNFIGQLVWESTTQPTNAGSARFSLQKKTESIYCYAQDKSKRNGFLLKTKENALKYPHKGQFGPCRFEIIEKSDAGTYKRDSMKFPILGQFPREGKRWQIGEETAKALIEAGRIEIVNGIVKKAVYPEDEINKENYEPFWSLLTADEVDTAQTGKDELNTILGENIGFDTVKPTALINELLSHFPKDILVLDFFAGSGTTGQSVLEMNAKDEGDRHFILCTNNENDICEKITYERIKRVIDGYGDTEGIPANVMYYKTDFVPKDTDDLTDALLDHIAEMIQLEHGIKLDGEKYLLALNDEDVDELAKHWDEYSEAKELYISRDVILSTKQRKLFKNVKILTIPDYYFKFEMEEVGEV